jgi:Ni/Co efflux regulator RcnB
MKKTFVTAIAVLALASPFAPLASAQPNMQGSRHNQYQGHNSDSNNQAGDQHRDRHGYRQNWRDTRTNARWDETQHNGYYTGSRWHYGPPPQNYQRPVTFGYHRWSAGQRLGYYNGRYQEVDYRQEHLRRPHRGYHWVRDNDGDLLLAAVATGLIAQVILSGGHY